MTSSSKTSSPNFKRKISHWVFKTPIYVNLESSSKEHQNKKTPSPSPRKKSISPPHRLVSNFMESKDARLSKFEADFKQQQGEMTNKIDTFLKDINDQMRGALLSDTVRNQKLSNNSTSLVLFARSYPTKDPQCSSHIHSSINAIKTCSNQHNKNDQSKIKTLTVNEIGTPRSKEPEQTLEVEFKDLHLNLPVFEVLAHASMYNVILNKYVESLELGDSEPFDTLANLGSCVNLIPLYLFKKIKIELLEEIGHVFRYGKKDPAAPLLVGRGFLATASAVIDYRKAKIAVGEGITRCSTPFYARKHFLDHHLPREWEPGRDAELNTFKDILMFRKMVKFVGTIPINLMGNVWESEDLIENLIHWDKPPKEGDGAWHIRIEFIDPEGEKFKKTFQSIPVSRKLSAKKIQARSST
ncbi:hypothetical protein Tco_1286303 [Tanacetum coccineum]